MAIVLKNYVQSLCTTTESNSSIGINESSSLSSQNCHHQRLHSFSQVMYKKLLVHIESVQQEIIGANLVFDDERCTVLVIGNPVTVQRASNLLCQLFQANHSEHSENMHRPTTTTTTTHHAPQSIVSVSNRPWNPVNHIPVTRTVSDSYTSSAIGTNIGSVVPPHGIIKHNSHYKKSGGGLDINRRKLESEDSSYDSDQEQSFNNLSRSHDDVSRTVSETLGLEFSEHVNMEDVLTSITQDPNYDSNVEYALRLGYTESQLQKALLRLGRNVPQNYIVQELIREAAVTSSSTDKKDSLTPAATAVTAAIAQSDDVSSPSGTSTITTTNEKDDSPLPIIIDGSNVAMSHGPKEVFSCKGIQLAVKWFQERGHTNITVFVPRWRKETSKPESPIQDQHILTELEDKRFLYFTPSRQVCGKRVVCHDDRYILNLAVENHGIVVSNDNYRELISEKPAYKRIITEKILMYTFVNDIFMPPDDPLGKNGPSLKAFLRKKPKLTEPTGQPCPYDKKCTYGNKCKYYHADRVNNQQSISEKLKANSNAKINERRAGANKISRDSSPTTMSTDPLTRTVSLPQNAVDGGGGLKTSLCRTKSNVPRLNVEQQQQHQLHMTSWSNRSVKSQSIENISSKLQESCDINGGGWSNQLNMLPPHSGTIDLSMPPPPPRAPWSNNHGGDQQPPRMRLFNAGSMDQSNSHNKLSRQYSLNPNYDSRISKYNFPPPPLPHQNVTRIASAPEHHFYNQPPPPPVAINNSRNPYNNNGLPPHHGPSTTGLCPPPLSGLSPDGSPGRLTKSKSDSFPINKANYDSAKMEFDAARVKLYSKMCGIFPAQVVQEAMEALPDELDPMRIGEYMFNKKK